jgi:hypothetical protein
LRDSGTVAGQIARDRQQVTDGSGNPYALHRPGPRMMVDGDDAAEQAYRQMIADQAEAWRAGPSPQLDAATGVFAGAREGDSCMVDDTHEAGRMVRTASGELVCKANQRRDSASMFASDAQADAYRERCERGEQAWRTL